MRVNGWRMHYVDVGDPILLLHGNPTWGFLYRDVIPPLVRSGRRVIVPDMIGFRLSEKPVREYAHSLNGHIANLTGLVRQLDLQRLTVVCHDWGGPTGLGFAMSDPERIRALSVMTTWPGRRRRPSSVPAYSPGAPCMHRCSGLTCWAAGTMSWRGAGYICRSLAVTNSGVRPRSSTTPCCPTLRRGF
jgi:pimeloyl-ACP methyl ester carboxylesterase